MSRHKTKGNRLSKQNYCSFCKYKDKVDGKSICTYVNLPVDVASRECELLKPFDLYRKYVVGE
jgi:hypothetical protein